MLKKIRLYISERNRRAQRAALGRELDQIDLTRKYFERRELEITREVNKLESAELHYSIGARVQRGW